MNRQEYNDKDLDFTIETLLEFVDRFYNDILLVNEIQLNDFENFFDFVKNLKYIKYPDGLEVIQRQKYTILKGQGDCDQKCLLIASWFKLFRPDFKQFFKIVGKDHFFEHIYNTVEINGELIPLDATYNFCKIGKEFKHNIKKLVVI